MNLTKHTFFNPVALTLSAVYDCQNANDLIIKMGLELNMYENYVKKLNDLCFILNLKLNGEENSSAISGENFSKFFVVKIVLEKMLEKSSGTYVNDSDTSMNTSQNNFNNTMTKSSRSGFGGFGGENVTSNVNKSDSNKIDLGQMSDSDKKKLENFDKIRNCGSINDLLDLEGENDNNNDSIIKHITSILKDFLTKISIGYNDLIKKYSSKKNATNPDYSIKTIKHNLSIEGLLGQRLLIEKILIGNVSVIFRV